MKKLFIALILISIIFTMVSCDNQTEPVVEVDTFEIYLATSESVREYGYYDFENLILDGQPVITGADVRHYFWDQHIIELNGSFLEKLFYDDKDGYENYDVNIKGLRQYETGGSRLLSASQNMCFVIVVDGVKAYSGTFPAGPLLPESHEKLVIGDIDEDKIALVFDGNDFDIRNNDAVYDYFNSTSKISQMSGEDSTELVAELQDRLENSERQFNELQALYEDLLNSPEEINRDYKEATVKWLQNRLDLYMLETQEGDAYSRFTKSLLGLDLTDIESISAAAELFEYNTVPSTEKNDRMFNAFEELYYVIIEGISFYNSIDEIDEDFIKTAEENWITVKTNGSNITAYPMTGKLRENFGLYLTPQLNEYLLIKDFENAISDAAEASDVVMNDTLEVPFDDLARLMYMWKKYSVDYPYSYPFNFKATMQSEYLMDIYIGRTVLADSPLYTEESLMMKDEAKASYERFIVDHTDSPYYPVILEIYRLLKDNEFVFSQNVEEYINSIDYDAL